MPTKKNEMLKSIEKPDISRDQLIFNREQKNRLISQYEQQFLSTQEELEALHTRSEILQNQKQFIQGQVKTLQSEIQLLSEQLGTGKNGNQENN